VLRIDTGTRRFLAAASLRNNNKRDEKLAGEPVGGIAKRDQFSNRIFFLRERSFGLVIDDGEYVAAKDPADEQPVVLDAHYTIFLVED
jgi:hypothetical protein